MQKSKLFVFLNALLFAASVLLLLCGVFVQAGFFEGGMPAIAAFYTLSALVFFLWLFLLFVRRTEKRTEKTRTHSLFERIFLSEIMLEGSASRRIALTGVTAALCIVSNMFEFRFADIQFSLTVFTSALAGILIGPFFGFVAVFLGDAVGYVANSWGYLYLPWVGLSCAVMALLAGLVMKLPFRFRGSGYAKLALLCILILVVCSVGINTTGFYFYYTSIGFSGKALGLIEEHFGGGVTYFAYAVVRLLFMGQIWNNLLNYVLLFAVMPMLSAVKPLRIRFE